MMQGSLKHSDRALVQVESTLLYCFKEPDLGSLHLEQLHLIFDFCGGHCTTIDCQIKSSFQLFKAAYILLREHLESLAHPFDLRSHPSTHPHRTFHILSLVPLHLHLRVFQFV